MLLARKLVEMRRLYVREQRAIGEREAGLRVARDMAAGLGAACDRLYAQLFEQIAREELISDGTAIECAHASGAV